MKTWFAAAAVGLFLLLLPGVSNAQAPALDSVTGQGGVIGNFTWLFDAHSGPSGQDPGGQVVWHFGGGLGPTSNTVVTCLSVTGNTAVIGSSGSVTGIFRYWIAGLFKVVDAGGPAIGGDTFEWAELDGPPGETPVGDPLPGPTDCSSYPGSFPLLKGPFSVGASGDDIVVTDAKPLTPTTKEQCKKGGWRSFGIFKNQGDCVGFVTHQAHQACIFERVAHGIVAFRAKYGRPRDSDYAMRRCIRLRIGV